jgi:transposase
MGYTGPRTKNMAATLGCDLEIVKRPRKWYRIPEEVEDVNQYLVGRGITLSEGFKVLPRRWVVERTFAWLNRYRRLSKDYEYSCTTSEAMIWLATVRTTLKKCRKLAHEFEDTLL